MNAEMSRIRKLRNNQEEIYEEPKKLDADRICEIVVDLNENFKELYGMQKRNEIDIDKFAEAYIANIYIILDVFDEIGIYPDYFYDEIVKMNTEYKKTIENNNNIKGNYRLFKKVNLSARIADTIKKGVENGHYRIRSYQKKDINDAFLEMVGFFQAFNIPYGIKTKEQCSKIFSEIQFNHLHITEEFLNSDFLFEDIEYLSRLLFEYISFFAAMGMNPKPYIDEYIENKESTKHK